MQKGGRENGRIKNPLGTFLGKWGRLESEQQGSEGKTSKDKSTKCSNPAATLLACLLSLQVYRGKESCPPFAAGRGTKRPV